MTCKYFTSCYDVIFSKFRSAIPLVGSKAYRREILDKAIILIMLMQEILLSLGS